MNNAGKKRPLKECLGYNNSNELRHKRRRFDNVVLLRESGGDQNSNGLNDRRYYGDNESPQLPPRRILRAGGKRKKPIGLDESPPQITSTSKAIAKETNNENDIINELTKEFKKARLRPVFFTISSFIEQTVDEVGFTMADEPETGLTIRLAGVPRKEEFTATANIMVVPDEHVDPESLKPENDSITTAMTDRCNGDSINLKLNDGEKMTNGMDIYNSRQPQ